MPTLADILAAKQPYIFTVSPTATVMDAVRRMNLHRLGALVVMKDNTIVGIFTERDILRRVTAQLRSPRDVIIQEVMTPTVTCCLPHTDIEEAKRIMGQHRIRHLPVVDSRGELQGMIALGDLNGYPCLAQQAETPAVQYVPDAA
jgi:CBS domain-containing protein